MSQTTASKIAAGLTAGLGLAWSSAMAPPAAAAPQDMAAPVAAATAPAAPAEPAPARVLLMSDGRVIQGTILETDDGYMVKTGFGPLTFRRRDVVRAFSGIPEVYAYKRSIVPENDPDERLKLAQWCLGQKMYREAQTELELVLAYSPGLKQAEQMQHMLASKLEVPADDAVMLSAATGDQVDRPRKPAPDPAGDEGAEPPATLSANVLRELRDEYRKNPRSGDMPVILDLSPQQAVQRYREFATFVHPSLQRYCAGCHNEQSDSSFRLIQTRVRRDMENDLVIRANLDAVLPLIDTAQPERSKLLTNSIMPHPPTNRPVLTGPNSRTYQQFAAWVQGVTSPEATPTAGRPAAKLDTASRAGFMATTGDAAPSPAGQPQTAGGGFAVDRGEASRTTPVPGASAPRSAVQGNPPVLHATPPVPTPVVHFPPAPAEVIEPTAAGQIFPESIDGKPRSVPPDSAFRVPTAEQAVKSIQGARVAPAGSAGATGPAAVEAGKRPNSTPIVPADWTGPVPGTTLQPAAAVPPTPPAESPAVPAPPARPSKPIKIRGDVLQKFMSGRSGPASP